VMIVNKSRYRWLLFVTFAVHAYVAAIFLLTAFGL
jgi:hypothetical protein